MIKRLAGQPLFLLALSVIGAALAAYIEQLIGAAAHDGTWDTTKLWQDLVRNAFIAVLFTWLTKRVQTYQDRIQTTLQHATSIVEQMELIQLTVKAWPKPPDSSEDPRSGKLDHESLSQLMETVNELSDTEKTIRELADRELDDSNSVAKNFLDFDLLRFPLQTYILEGGRSRRLIYLSALSDGLAPVEGSPNRDLALSVRTFRTKAVNLLGAVQHTNTVVIERLLVERVTLTWLNRPPESHRLFETYGAGGLHPSAIAHDPLYLLMFHIQQVLRAADSDNPASIDLEVVRLLSDQLRRALHALSNEIRAVITCTNALIALARTAIAVSDGVYH